MERGAYDSAFVQCEWTGKAFVQGRYICVAENFYGKDVSPTKILAITDSGQYFFTFYCLLMYYYFS